MSTCIGPSLVTWPEDANALSIHADQYRRQTPSVVVQFLLENTAELFGPAPSVLASHIVKEEEVQPLCHPPPPAALVGNILPRPTP